MAKARINSISKAVEAGILTLSVAPIANHTGEEGAETWVGVQGRELQRAPEVLDVALAGVDGLLDVVERVAVFAAAGLDAGERGEGGGVSRVGGYGPLQDLLRHLQVVGRVVEARVRVERTGVRGIYLQRFHEVLFRPPHLPLTLVEDAELEVGLRVLGVEGQIPRRRLGRPAFVSQGEPGLPEGYEVPDLIPPQRHGLLRELQGLGQVLPQGEQMGGQFVPDLRRAGTVLEAPPESGLRLLQITVAGVADPQVRVGLPPVGRPRYDLLVSPYGLGVTA